MAPRPHTLEFLRYDMNFNRLTLKWETLEEVRQQGKYVRDAREEVRGSWPCSFQRRITLRGSFFWVACDLRTAVGGSFVF